MAGHRDTHRIRSQAGPRRGPVAGRSGRCVCCRFDPRGRFVFCGLESSTIQRVVAGRRQEGRLRGRARFVGVLAGVLARRRDDVQRRRRRARRGLGDRGRVARSRSGRSRPTADGSAAWASAATASSWPAAGNDRVVRLWEASTGRLVHELTGHQNQVYSLDFHPDGQTLITGDLLGSIRQWDLATGKAVGELRRQAATSLRRAASRSITAACGGWPSRPMARSSRAADCTRPRTRSGP